MSHRKKPFSHKQKKKQIQAKRERQREAFEIEEKRERGEYVPEKRREPKKDSGNNNGRGVFWVSNVTDDGHTLRTVFEKEPQSVIEARKKDAMKPITRKIQKEKRTYYGQILEIPTRPEWVYGMSKEELEKQEKESFDRYLRNIYDTHPREKLNMFEHNLEVWRQLWRVCETSDLLCVLTDIRHPIFHFPPSLYRYVVHYHKKPLILVLTKADLVPDELVKKWVDFFKTHFPQIRVAAVNSITRFKEDLTKTGTKRKARVVMRKSDRYNGRWIDLLNIINSIVVDLGAEPITVPERQLAKQEEEKEEAKKRKTKESEDEDENEEGVNKAKAKAKGREAKNKRKTKGSDEEGEGSEGDESEGESSEEVPEEVKAKEAEDEYEEYIEYMKELSEGKSEGGEGVPKRMKKDHVTIGFIGSPNVGKSTLINALMGRKFCSESRTPGHTKHRQTLYINPTLVVADCPGLVFPAVNIPRELQVLCGIFPIAQCREPYSAIKFLGERIALEDVYKLEKETPGLWSAYDICDAYADKRGYHTKAGRTNTHRAGIEILQHVVDGKISWNFDPDSVKIDLGVYLEGKKTLQDEEDEEVVEEVIEGESEEDEDESEEEVKAVKKVPVKKQVKSESEEEEDSDESDDEVDEDDGGADYDNPFAVLGSQ